MLKEKFCYLLAQEDGQGYTLEPVWFGLEVQLKCDLSLSITPVIDLLRRVYSTIILEFQLELQFRQFSSWIQGFPFPMFWRLEAGLQCPCCLINS